MNILFLSAWFPYPPNNGSKLRIYNLLRGLAREHQVTLITLSENEHTEIPSTLNDLCQNVHIVPAKPYNPKSIRSLIGFFSPEPRVLVDCHVPAMAERIHQELDTGKYDLVVASQWYMAAYWRTYCHLPAIFEEVEVGVFHDKRVQASTIFSHLRHELTYLKMKVYYRNLLSYFRACTVVSDIERDLLKKMVPNYQAVDVIPNGVSLADYADISKEPQPETLIFTGSFRYLANYDAMLWFLEEVYPKISLARPGVRLIITGDHAGKPIPQTGNIGLTGHVSDIRPLIASSWVSIAPIKKGGGTRLKILEAMALGTPVVSTPKGAEGLNGHQDEHLFIADTPGAFANKVIELLEDSNLRQRISDNAYQFVREKYDWAVVMPRFLNLVERVRAK
jgi:glycosyltransferase involved in cell wall biosynthesis